MSLLQQAHPLPVLGAALALSTATTGQPPAPAITSVQQLGGQHVQDT